MRYWGKLLGTVGGFVVGGPLGAFVGAAVGHAADGGGVPRIDVNRILGGTPFDPARIAASFGQRDQLFAISVVVLSAKLAKCDGPVTRPEIDAFKRQFSIPPQATRDIGRLFDQARDSAAGYESYARELGRSFADNKGLLEDILTALFAIARADKQLTNAEHQMLRQIHKAFGLDDLAWEQARGGVARRASEAENPYAVLGVARGATDAEIRAAWLKEMRENHPDSLAARGVTPDFIARAGEKVARVNAAWDQVKRERGL